MTDKAELAEDFSAASVGEVRFLPLNQGGAGSTSVEREQRLDQRRSVLADSYYGSVPPAPDSLQVVRRPLSSSHVQHLTIDMTVADRHFSVDAALWLPEDRTQAAPLICGLDFIGPVGVLTSHDFPIDARARISPRPTYGASDGRLRETLRGVSAYRWPVGMMLDAGYAVLVSCYGSWVPDDASEWKTHGVCPLLFGDEAPPTGAISLWAWAIQRLLDAANTIQEVDLDRVSVAGHSRLGKAALWAAANDARIGTVFANNSGCGGSAPSAHPVGETLAQMHERFPHWSRLYATASLPVLPFDQHHLLSLIAPRAVYLAAAKSDLWSDPIGSYLALREASCCWEPGPENADTWMPPIEVWNASAQRRHGSLGYHLRSGGHDLLPFDWRQFLAFKAAC